MKIFLVWSGERSFEIAKALNDWLGRVIQAVKPFFSHEIEKGAKWASEIDSTLEGTNFGIVCLTPDNLNSTWIHYETGALSKTKEALIWTYLSDLRAGDVPQPLGKFQHTEATKDDTLRLLRSINKRLLDVGGEPLSDAVLEENFEMFWPKLEKELQVTKRGVDNIISPQRAQRDQAAMLDEILEILRNQERRRSKNIARQSAEEFSYDVDHILPSLPPDRILLSIITSNAEKEWQAWQMKQFFPSLSPSQILVKLLKLQEQGLLSINKGKYQITDEGKKFLESED